MANQEQVELLLQGVRTWNKWRERNPVIEIDLSDANLRNVDLNGADLSSANLNHANLFKANLREAELTGAKLNGTKLHKANLSGAILYGSDLRDAILFSADLKNTKLSGSKLICANLCRANLICADLYSANLRDANLRDANLRDADLSNADLIGADLTKTNLESTTLNYAIVDGKTLIVRCKINDSTYAHGVGLDSARVEESLKIKLKKNIRKKYWEERYPHCINPRTSLRLLKLLLAPKRWHSAFGIVWSCIVRGFWMASDYGSSTKQILKTFWCWSLFFSVAYLITSPAPDVAFWPTPLDNPFLDNFGTANIFEQNICNNFPGSFFCYFQLWFRSLYFSVVTMTTLGFGDIHAHPLSVPGQALVMFQVLIGYVLLGVLITRLSILFQDVG